MTEHTLSIGAPKEDGDADLYTHFDDLTITRTASSTGTWTAVIPSRHRFDDDILRKIWIYNDEELLFRGVLESFDVDYSDGLTTIGGRGLFADLDRKTDTVTYTDTTVYDILVDRWSKEEWDALVLPPNRDEFDQNFGSNADHRSLWAYQSSGLTEIYDDNVEVKDNKVVFNQPNYKLDDETDNNYQNFSFTTGDEYEEIWMLIQTETPVTWLKGGMKQMPFSGDDPVIAEKEHVVTHNTPQNYHLFQFEFNQSVSTWRPTIEIGETLTNILSTEIFVVDNEGYVEIDELEMSGTRLDVLKEAHDVGSYEFVVEDFENLDVRSFPKGTRRHEPDWKVVGSNRSDDYTNYGNKVTVEGARLDDGSSNKSTVQSDSEIAFMDERGIGDDGVVEAFERNPSISSQEEVQSRAERFLEESIEERDQSGSLEIAPKAIAPGYTYNVGIWTDSFPYGGHIGLNSLYFRGDESPGVEPDHVEFSYAQQENVRNSWWTFEFLVYPQDLEYLDDDEYYTFFSLADEDGEAQHRIYGDGSIAFGEFNALVPGTRTDPRVIKGGERHRITIQWAGNGNTTPDDEMNRRAFVDGVQVLQDNEVSNSIVNKNDAIYYLGCDSNKEHPYKGGIDDVRIYYHEGPEDWLDEETIRAYMYTDLLTTEFNPYDLVMYLRFNDDSNPDEVVNDGNTVSFSSSVNGAQYQDAYGQVEEVQYSLGSGETATIDFDISGRIDTELVSTQRSVLRNTRLL